MKTSTPRTPRKKAGKAQSTLFAVPAPLHRFAPGPCPFGVGTPAGKLSNFAGGAAITGDQLLATFGEGKWSEWYGPAEVGLSPLWTFLDRETGKAFFVCTDEGKLIIESELPALVPVFVAWLVEQLTPVRVPSRTGIPA